MKYRISINKILLIF